MGEAKDQMTSGGWSDDQPDLVAYEISTTAVTGDAEVDQLVDEIAYTRDEMTGTVEEIGDRLDPRHIVAEAKGSVRDATIGKVEEMATTAQDMVSNVGQTAQETGSGVVDTIRRNPLPAAMIGIGLTWLAMSNRSTGTRSSDWTSGGRWNTKGSSWDTTGGSYEGSGDGMTDRVGGAVGQVQGKAGEVAGQVQQTAAQVPYVARQVGDNAARVVQENPLAVGAVALAVGAAVGMALPTTRPEHEIMGQARDSLIGRAESAASDAMNQAEASARQP
jgi:ElaB/YqjD/DUF883 family membrane-anchored ribosome-binding protein